MAAGRNPAGRVSLAALADRKLPKRSSPACPRRRIAYNPRMPAVSKDPALRLLAELCSVPTAPFAEGQVVAFVERFARARKLHVSRDRWGNLLLSKTPVPKKGRKRLVLAAHLDHPGFVVERCESGVVRAHFRGGVLAEYIVPGTKVRFFPSVGMSAKPATTMTAPGVRATVVAVSGQTKERPYPTSAVLECPTDLAPGTPGMFDFTPAKFTRTNFHSRVCDDLAGAAAALATFDRLKGRKTWIDFAVLLTRAEEVGFIGALGAVLHPQLLRKADDLLLAIECSAEQPYARQHDGVILRVGDRTSIFNSSLTAFLHDTAQSLAKRETGFRFQRALMPGGTCESTVYDAWGYHAAAVCVPLGNYHNMDRTKKVLAPEHVSTSDYLHMVRLFEELALTAHTYAPGHKPLVARLTRSFKDKQSLLIG